MKKLTFSILLAALFVNTSFAQDFKFPAPSPSTKIEQDFSTSTMTIEYSRPSMKGRKVMGDMLPYGKIWRTGANGATKITFGEAVLIDGKEIPAGTYSLYTTPNEKTWTIVLNKGTTNWGVTGYDTKDDVIKFEVPTTKTSNKVETFTISIDDITNNTCNISLNWENTKVIIPIKTETDKRMEAHFATAMTGEKAPYLQAARYYAEKNKNLDNALIYANKAMEANPKAFWIHALKADILNKKGDKKAATLEAKLAAEAAKGSPYEGEYNRVYQSYLKK